MPIEKFKCSFCKKPVVRQHTKPVRPTKRYCSESCAKEGQRAQRGAWVVGGGMI